MCRGAQSRCNRHEVATRSTRGLTPLISAGSPFFNFQWDILLLESTFMAIFMAPRQWLPRRPGARPALPGGIWLTRCLLFKLMFLSGIVKLLSGDATWFELTALDFHYETQPLPTWTAWYAHHLPAWFQKLSVALMFVIELVLPFLIFAPRRLRHLAAAGLVLLQVLIAATGNYNFFNLLTMALCLPLLDDRLLERAIPRKWRERAVMKSGGSPSRIARAVGVSVLVVVLFISALTFAREMERSRHPQRITGAPAAMLDFLDSALLSWGDPYLLRFVGPLRTINGYGLFRVMTTKRPEIVIEASLDGETWQPYEVRWKPGDVERRPRFVAPHQPRLDWQMWFAALDIRRAGWIEGLLARRFEGSEPVLALFDRVPFEGRRPTYLRLVMYEYHFTTPEQRSASGAWWRRTRMRATGVIRAPAPGRGN